MRFSVSVPVLSRQMTVVAPRLSTAASRRTSILWRIMRCMPRASVVVATAGRPSGTAATASDTAAAQHLDRRDAAQDAQAERDAAEAQRHGHELAAHAIELPLERCRRRRRLGHESPDAPDLGVRDPCR